MPRPKRVLLCTSNGAGLGHVTRMMAVAEQLPDSIEPVLFTLSSAIPIPVAAGLRVEHLPSAGYVPIESTDWHELLEDRVEHLIAHYRPQVAVFDGVHPYRGLTNAFGRNRRRLRRIWMRRGMWRPGVGAQALESASHFDEVIEPGEYAAGYDRGATADLRHGSWLVEPVCYRGRTPRPDRSSACQSLQLDSDSVNVLVQLGAGTINDVESTSGAVIEGLLARGAHPVVARSVLSAGEPPDLDGVTIIQEFPVTRWFAAFDAAAIATGYNSFHECLSFGLPSLMVPNLHTRTDDQDARSRWAHDRGVGIRWAGVDRAGLEGALDQLIDPDHRTTMRQTLSELGTARGSTQIADHIATLIR